jgi:iron complex transport system ATP-binding protein
VLVTHHVEEITPAFTHALLLQGGRVLAAGPRRQLLNSKQLSTLFATAVTLRRDRDGLRLHFPTPAHSADTRKTKVSRNT